MAIGDIYRVAILGRSSIGDLLVNTLYYKQASANLYDTPTEDLAHAFVDGDALSTYYAAAMSDDARIDGVSVRGVTDPTEGFDLSFDPSIVGGLVGDQLPPQAACVVTFTTSRIGRSYRGRNYMFPANEDNQSGGTWNEGYLEAVGDYATRIQSMGELGITADYGQVVWSPTLTESTPVTGHKVRTFVRTQRRRGAGTGA